MNTQARKASRPSSASPVMRRPLRLTSPTDGLYSSGAEVFGGFFVAFFGVAAAASPRFMFSSHVPNFGWPAPPCRR